MGNAKELSLFWTLKKVKRRERKRVTRVKEERDEAAKFYLHNFPKFSLGQRVLK